MYSLLLKCSAEEVDRLSGELWEAGTAGIQEWDAEESTLLIAAFESNETRPALLQRFAAFNPDWRQEASVDWVQHSQAAWPAREIGSKLFLTPKWCGDPTPAGRVRLVHNPGLACGTGEHPCTQLALAAIEEAVVPGDAFIDVGTGSGILAIGAMVLGAGSAIGIDIDVAALSAARENFELNSLEPSLIGGSADCIGDAYADVTVANMNATVLLSILDDLLRITRPTGRLILTGFTDRELPYLQSLIRQANVSEREEWRCITIADVRRS